MSQIVCQPLDVNNDIIWGQGPANLLSDLDAVTLIIRTRLLLFQGEWWANQQDGLPLWQQILGVGQGAKQQQKAALLIQDRILGTPFVVSLSNVVFSFNSGTRLYSFSCSVQTQFGIVAVTSSPTPPSQGLPQ